MNDMKVYVQENGKKNLEIFITNNKNIQPG